ncbi:hypothetical protein M0R19_03930 [Candidatus Pacearchaeota archaeon]|nr:hypothetical protein [Candidatus Pacearchaeota archaeon]
MNKKSGFLLEEEIIKKFSKLAKIKPSLTENFLKEGKKLEKEEEEEEEKEELKESDLENLEKEKETIETDDVSPDTMNVEGEPEGEPEGGSEGGSEGGKGVYVTEKDIAGIIEKISSYIEEVTGVPVSVSSSGGGEESGLGDLEGGEEGGLGDLEGGEEGGLGDLEGGEEKEEEEIMEEKDPIGQSKHTNKKVKSEGCSTSSKKKDSDKLKESVINTITNRIIERIVNKGKSAKKEDKKDGNKGKKVEKKSK